MFSSIIWENTKVIHSEAWAESNFFYTTQKNVKSSAEFFNVFLQKELYKLPMNNSKWPQL